MADKALIILIGISLPACNMQHATCDMHTGTLFSEGGIGDGYPEEDSIWDTAFALPAAPPPAAESPALPHLPNRLSEEGYGCNPMLTSCSNLPLASGIHDSCTSDAHASSACNMTKL